MIKNWIAIKKQETGCRNIRVSESRDARRKCLSSLSKKQSIQSCDSLGVVTDAAQCPLNLMPSVSSNNKPDPHEPLIKHYLLLGASNADT